MTNPLKTQCDQTMNKHGDRVVSVRGVPGGRGYWAPGVYEARERELDGALTWRLVENPLGILTTSFGHQLPVGFRSPAKAERIGEELARERGLPFKRCIRQGTAAGSGTSE